MTAPMKAMIRLPMLKPVKPKEPGNSSEEDKPADERADNASDDIAQNAQPCAFHDKAGQPTGDAAYDNPREDVNH